MEKVLINGHDYTRYIRHKTGLSWSSENTNAESSGRDAGEVMHTDVTSHQRKLSIKMLRMPFSVAQQLAHDLADNDAGVEVVYPDLYDGSCKRLFYNTSIKGAIVQFTEEGVLVDDISFDLITVKEEKLNG